MKRTILLTVLVMSLGLANAWGDSLYSGYIDPNLLDPATLQMGTGAGTACATGGCPTYNNEVNVFTSTVSIYQNQGGASALDSPVLLILGLPDTTALNFSIGSVGLYTDYPSGGGPASVGWSLMGYQGWFDGSSVSGFDSSKTAKDIYDFLGLTSDASNSFGNWSAWDSAVNGFTPSGFGIYAFALDTSAFASKDLLNIAFTGDIPVGTFAVAWGAYPNASNGSDYFSTPFTNAGLTDGVPEPATISLMLAGILILFGLAAARKRFFQQD